MPAHAVDSAMARFVAADARSQLGSTWLPAGGGWAMTASLPCTGRYTWLLQGRIGCCRKLALLPGHYVSVEGSPASVVCNHGSAPADADFDIAPIHRGTTCPSSLAIARVDFDRDELVLVRANDDKKWYGCGLTQGLNIKRHAYEEFKLAVGDVKHDGFLSICKATDDILVKVNCKLDSFVQQYQLAVQQLAAGECGDDDKMADGGQQPAAELDFHGWTPNTREGEARLLSME